MVDFMGFSFDHMDPLSPHIRLHVIDLGCLSQLGPVKLEEMRLVFEAAHQLDLLKSTGLRGHLLSQFPVFHLP